MTLDFCAIDFETANAFRGSPCAVGLAKVIDGEVVESRRYLMRPPEGFDDFDAFNVMIHGITPETVAREPRFGRVLPEIVAFAGGLPFVAHNAAFDMGVIRDACDASEISWPPADYACTLVLSRVTWRLLSYSLPWVAEAAGVSLTDHHEPEADALAAASIMTAIAQEHGAGSLDDVLSATTTRLGSMSADAWSGCKRVWAGSRRLVPTANDSADPDHPSSSPARSGR